jgi:hypothetical protein
VSTLLGAAIILGGIGLLTYDLYSLVVALASRGSWLALSFVVLLILAAAFYLWISPLTKRLVFISVLAVLSFAASPIIERVLI